MFDDALGAMQHIDDTTQNTDSEYCGPVSYTHLDVYKRQAEESGCILKTLYADPFAWAGESIVPVAHDFQRSFYTDLIRCV